MSKKPTQRNPSKGSPVETKRFELALRLAEQLNTADSPAELVPDLLSEIQSFTGFAAVGLRLKQEEDFPYYDTSGFPQTLVISENHLAQKHPNGETVRGPDGAPFLEGMCGHVLSGRFDPDVSCFSTHGSFWTNDIQSSYADPKLKESMGPLRGRCLEKGYRSMALIPLQVKDRIVGLLHLSDFRQDLLDEDQIRFLEKIGMGIGAALVRMGWENRRTDHHLHLQKEVDRSTEELVRINEELRKEIEDRSRVEAELRESQASYSALFHNSPFRTVIVDRDGRITAFHPGTLKTDDTDSKAPKIGARMYTADFAGRHAIDMRAELMSVIESGQARTLDNLAYDDRYLSVIISPFSQGAIITTFDVTDRKQAEEGKKKFEAQILQAQKLEAVGTLAGGIAHDFNNILWIITGNTELAAGTIDEDNPAQHNLRRIEQASQRAKDLVSQILSFSRQSAQEEKKPLKINAIVKESLKLMRASLPATIDIRQNMPAESPTVLADLSQINQVIVNLCTNAAHAMRERGGILNVSMVEIELDKDEAARHQDLAPGKYAILSVMDTGHGITAENMDRIFDPFYSTKQIDEGIGMGLSVTHGIVKNHGGAITVHSKPDTGATFHVLLPTMEKEKPACAPTPFDAIPKGSERILYVDDDQGLLDMGETILRRLGYRVTATPSPVEALTWIQSRPDRFDLVITDQTMPRMTGENLARELLRIHPNLPIILCTGYSGLIDETKAAAIGIRAFLFKPVVMEKLAQTIRRVLDPPPSPEPAAPIVPSDKTI
ncbi:MAG: response regulator [Desulfobacterales bacterium]|nr:response regulator [Desulfobacterales bacterium]